MSEVTRTVAKLLLNKQTVNVGGDENGSKVTSKQADCEAHLGNTAI